MNAVNAMNWPRPKDAANWREHRWRRLQRSPIVDLRQLSEEEQGNFALSSIPLLQPFDDSESRTACRALGLRQAQSSRSAKAEEQSST